MKHFHWKTFSMVTSFHQKRIEEDYGPDNHWIIHFGGHSVIREPTDLISRERVTMSLYNFNLGRWCFVSFSDLKTPQMSLIHIVQEMMILEILTLFCSSIIHSVGGGALWWLSMISEKENEMKFLDIFTVCRF